MDKILVIGASGQLGQALKAVSEDRAMNNVVFLSEKEADILDKASLALLVAESKPRYVINCAAYTAVDKAEDEAALAKAINEIGAANLAQVCMANNVILVHISTDFVFEGNEVKLLTELDEPKPINMYGQTKLDGENAIRSILPTHFIIRTSWLYSEFGNNFVKTMLKLSENRSELNVIADQVGTPTYAVDLAKAIFDIIYTDSRNFGLYHYSNEGVTSWYDFASAIFQISGNHVQVNPIPTSAYPTRAKRPSFSVMDKSKIKNTFKIVIPHWRTSLEKCISQLNK